MEFRFGFKIWLAERPTGDLEKSPALAGQVLTYGKGRARDKRNRRLAAFLARLVSGKVPRRRLTTTVLKSPSCHIYRRLHVAGIDCSHRIVSCEAHSLGGFNSNVLVVDKEEDLVRTIHDTAAAPVRDWRNDDGEESGVAVRTCLEIIPGKLTPSNYDAPWCFRRGGNCCDCVRTLSRRHCLYRLTGCLLKLGHRDPLVRAGQADMPVSPSVQIWRSASSV